MALELAVPLGAAIIDWQGLLQVVVFAIVTGLAIVGAFSLGVVGLDRWSKFRGNGGGAHAEGANGASPPTSIADAAMPVDTRRPTVAYGSLAMAIAGFGICVIGVGLGLYSMIHK